VTLLGASLFSLLLSVPVVGEPLPYRVATQREAGGGVAVEIPYSFGTHRAIAGEVEGEIRLERETLEVLGGHLRVPIAALKSDDPERDCHTRESLGLNYASSRFPKDHVCDDHNQLPLRGGDAIAFPYIDLLVTASKVRDDPRLLDQGKDARVLVTGSWTIHGVTRPARLQLTASADGREGGTLRVRGREVFVLRDFGIVVKSAKILFVSSVVKEEVTAIFHLRLKPLQAN
jgi:polyisoprenoid-binding protein YceI